MQVPSSQVLNSRRNSATLCAPVRALSCSICPTSAWNCPYIDAMIEADDVRIPTPIRSNRTSPFNCIRRAIRDSRLRSDRKIASLEHHDLSEVLTFREDPDYGFLTVLRKTGRARSSSITMKIARPDHLKKDRLATAVGMARATPAHAFGDFRWKTRRSGAISARCPDHVSRPTPSAMATINPWGDW